MTALARTILRQPELIILDEPFAALDHKTKEDIIRQFLSWRKEFNFTYLIVSHDLDFVRGIADRVVLLEKGKVAAMAPTNEFFKPQH